MSMQVKGAIASREVSTGKRYDRITIGFHWLTAILVVALFGTSWAWNWAPRSFGWHRPLEWVHVSLGILLAAAIVGRLLWRASAGRRLPHANKGPLNVLALGVHGLLYVLLIAEIILGFGMRWLQGEPLDFFGWFLLPAPFGSDRHLAHNLENLHNYAAWAIVILAGGHALTALIHHYWRRDGVLARMSPLGE